MRILDQLTNAEKRTKKAWLDSIAASCGRAVLCELFTSKTPMLGDVSNVELAAAFGADLILLNDFEPGQSTLKGLPLPFDSISALKRQVGSSIGIDLYVINDENKDWPTAGLSATEDNVALAVGRGFDFINLVADPVAGVSNAALIEALSGLPQALKDEIPIMCGRMNMAGLTEPIEEVFSADFVQSLAKAGASVFVMPLVGTAQGMTMDLAASLVKACRKEGLLVMTGIGSSQEGADTDIIKTLALMARQVGSDIHHLGDAGYISGVATPENIMAYSIAIKGKRHTYRRMAASPNRYEDSAKV